MTDANTLPSSPAPTELSVQADEIMNLLLAETGQEKVKVMAESLGKEEQSRAASNSRMLSVAIRDISQHSGDEGDVAKQLTSLKMEVQRLDPSSIDFSQKGSGSRLLSLLPFIGDPIKRYFTQYESAQSVISTIVQSLRNGQMQLVRDNATLEEDKKNMVRDAERLNHKVQLAMELDTKLNYKMERDWREDEIKKKFVSEELIFPLRQRTMDLQQQLAVNQQGVLAAEILVKNNKELIRNVDRGINVTVSALETAVAVALALNNQKLVLDQINALNKTTNDIIAGTAERLKRQGAEIQKASVNASLDVNKLKQAFANIAQAFVDISNFKQKALPEMSKSIQEFDKLSTAAADRIKKLESSRNALDAAAQQI